MRVADVLYVIIHESDFKSVACLELMAASATHKLLLEKFIIQREWWSFGQL